MSCYVIAVFGCSFVYVKCDVEADYIGVQAKAGDVTLYHADGKQPVTLHGTMQMGSSQCQLHARIVVPSCEPKPIVEVRSVVCL